MGDADLWIKFWEELHSLISREILVEVEHVTAHRTEKDKKEMSHFENFVTDGNEKADELAKAGAMWTEGFMAQVRAKSIQQEREEVCAALQYAASFHCGSSLSQKKNGYPWIKKEREQCIELSGVLQPADIDA